MQTEEVIKLINKRLKEHTDEAEATADAMAVKKEALKGNRDVNKAGEVMILKDKAMFHRACCLVLEDLLKEIQ